VAAASQHRPESFDQPLVLHPKADRIVTVDESNQPAGAQRSDIEDPHAHLTPLFTCLHRGDASVPPLTLHGDVVRPGIDFNLRGSRQGIAKRYDKPMDLAPGRQSRHILSSQLGGCGQ
jgi:hypothetical protein